MDGGSGPVIVSMPPHSPFLDAELNLVGEAVARLNWALSYVLWTVRPRISWLSNAVPAEYRDVSFSPPWIAKPRERFIILPVDCNAISALVVDSDEDGVSFPGSDGWAGEASVNSEHTLLLTQPGEVSLLKLQYRHSQVSLLAKPPLARGLTTNQQTYHEVIEKVGSIGREDSMQKK